jgi:hypothetical protein
MKHTAKKKPFECALCGAGVSAPYFFNGDVYGWSCIKVVNPSQKKYKNKIQVSNLSVKWFRFDSDSASQGIAAVMVNDRLDIARFKKISDNKLNVYGHDMISDTHYATQHSIEISH